MSRFKNIDLSKEPERFDIKRLEKIIKNIIPSAWIELADDGSIIIYTNLKQDENGELKES